MCSPIYMSLLTELQKSVHLVDYKHLAPTVAIDFLSRINTGREQGKPSSPSSAARLAHGRTEERAGIAVSFPRAVEFCKPTRESSNSIK